MEPEKKHEFDTAQPRQDIHLLQSQLAAYAAGGLYPLHMPGHKRQMAPAPGLPYGWDVTEVPGVDDLHDAHGILAGAMARTARLFGAARSFYLVGGSTAGLLAGIRALAPAGSTVIAARNCHKAVYHAIELGNLRAHWLVPPALPGWQVYGSVTPAAVEEALCVTPAATCVIVTSPTYEGVLSDIAGIATVCHRHGVPLLVDEAHGAHLGLFTQRETGFPAGAVHCGADVVVQSAHKTLPSLTQTALLHLPKGSMAKADEIERQLDIFETSSPSYPLLASLDACTGLLQKDGPALLRQWHDNLQELDAMFCRLTRLQLLCHGKQGVECHPEIFDFDAGKLCVRDSLGGVSGTALAEILRRQYGFETEMACGGNLLAMTSLADTPEALHRFGQALADLDGKLPPVGDSVQRHAAPGLPPPGAARCSIGQAVTAPAQMLPAAQAAGRLCGEYIWAYPPGVPLIAPGEEITPAFLQAAAALRATGTNLHHTGGSGEDCLRVLV